MKIKNILTEAETIEVTATPEETEGQTAVRVQEVIFDALDRCARQAVTQLKCPTSVATRKWPVLCIEGSTGVGKTQIVEQWAEANEFNMPQKDVKGMDIADMGGAVVPSSDGKDCVRLGTREFTEYSETPRTILFFDEYNRAKTVVRASLLTLLADHKVVAGPGNKEQSLSYGVGDISPITHEEIKSIDEAVGVWFIVIASNPAITDKESIEPYSNAELTRMTYVKINAADPLDTLAYYETRFGKRLKYFEEAGDEAEALMDKGRLDLARTLLSNPEFKFDGLEEEKDWNTSKKSRGTEQGLKLVPRSLEQTLDACDGTMEDFVHQYPGNCGTSKLGMVKRIFATTGYDDDPEVLAGMKKAKNDKDTGTTDYSLKANKVFAKPSLYNDIMAYKNQEEHK